MGSDSLSLEILGSDSLSVRPSMGTLDSIIQDLPDLYESAVTDPESKDWVEATNHELRGSTNQQESD